MILLKGEEANEVGRTIDERLHILCDGRPYWWFGRSHAGETDDVDKCARNGNIEYNEEMSSISRTEASFGHSQANIHCFDAYCI